MLLIWFSVFVAKILADFDANYELIENFLTHKSLNKVVLATCWSQRDNYLTIQKFSKNNISVSFLNINYYQEEVLFMNDYFSLSVYDTILGIIFDWSCFENEQFEFSSTFYWNSSYHWLMIMKDNTIPKFLNQKKINITVDCEIILAYQYGLKQNEWFLYDVYRTAYEPRGVLVVEELNYTMFGRWGNRSWKFDKRRNLKNLTLNAVTLVYSYDIPMENIRKFNQISNDDLIKNLQSSDDIRLNSFQKFNYAVMYLLTRNVLNMTMNLIPSFILRNRLNDSWSSVINTLKSENSDFSIVATPITTTKLEIVDFSAIFLWSFKPCFIIRRLRTLPNSINIFVRPFELNVWLCLIGVITLSAGVYYIIFYFESENSTFTMKTWSDIILLKIGALCQQGTVMDIIKFSNRIIVLQLFIFSMIVYQFYSSSIVSGLLRPISMKIDTAQKLEESGLDIGIENVNIVSSVVKLFSETDPFMKKVLDRQVNLKNEYFSAEEGIKKLKIGNYAFFTDPATSYFLINDIFTEREKCDLFEFQIKNPEVTGYMIKKKSPYKKLIIYGNSLLLEIGVINREFKIWHATKPQCIDKKKVTEENFLSLFNMKNQKTLKFLCVINVFNTIFDVSSSTLDINCTEHKCDLVKSYLTNRHIKTAILYTFCWTPTNKMQTMNVLSSLNITSSFRSTDDFVQKDLIENILDIPRYQTRLGVIVDWSCEESIHTRFLDSDLWNSSYFWLMMDAKFDVKEMEYILNLRNINLTLHSEIILTYFNINYKKWQMYDIYRTAYAPRGQIIYKKIDSPRFGEWGTRFWKYNQRSNLYNLTLNAIIVANSYGSNAYNTSEDRLQGKELIQYLKDYQVHNYDTINRYSYAILLPLSDMLNFSTFIFRFTLKSSNSWGAMINGSWDGTIASLISGKADFTGVAAYKNDRLDVVDYTALPLWRHRSCFIFRHPTTAEGHHALLKAFSKNAWQCLSVIFILNVIVFYIIFYFEGHTSPTTLHLWLNVILINISACCQQSYHVDQKKLASRMIFILVFLCGMLSYQFYSSSIVAGLLSPPVKSIDTLEKLADSNFKIGIEDSFTEHLLFNNMFLQISSIRKMIGVDDSSSIHRAEYVMHTEGAEKIRQGNYAFYTDTTSSYWFLSKMFVEKEKCDLKEIDVIKPTICSVMLQKKSPYTEIFSYGYVRLMEVGLIKRELNRWNGTKPTCIYSNIQSENAFVSIALGDILPALSLLFFGILTSITILVIENVTNVYKIN
ncbi:uncharacterized protein LOC126905038 [Daktulosphaira vitifoliae]|uniref:uncharacterized protein LOC126905038 n=1 Tax=Daktulosphaira vitifoliae TaxID=58002 RepID=UPI0021AA40D4|nr:uncharacterized protein LOC126905038 [Daktulosphaira vitifoliae]